MVELQTADDSAVWAAVRSEGRPRLARENNDGAVSGTGCLLVKLSVIPNTVRDLFIYPKTMLI